MILYEPGPEEDLLLLQWYNTLMETGDLAKAFTSRMYSIGAFMANMRPPLILLYEADEQGIWFASWYDGVMSALVQGLWARKDKRGKELVPVVGRSMRMVFDYTDLIMGLTRFEKVAQSAQLYGAKSHGIIPLIWEGESAYLISLTKEDFVRAYGE